MTATRSRIVADPPRNMAQFKRAMQPGVTVWNTFYQWREWRVPPAPQETHPLTICEANSVGLAYNPNPAVFPTATGKVYHRFQHASYYHFREDGWDMLSAPCAPGVTPARDTIIASYRYAPPTD